jgi:integrase
MREAEQDAWLADFILEGFESGSSKAMFGSMLSALSKVNPRCLYKISWKVLDVWKGLDPAVQAPALPPEVITAMIAISIVLGRSAIGLAMALCFCGLLRAREALSLRFSDVIFGANDFILCLSRTKRGLEQKVVCTHASIRTLLSAHVKRMGPSKPDDFLLQVSYGSFLRWCKKLPELLGLSMPVTTHSFRRSGASEMSRMGIDMLTICNFGRWASERSAREYIRRGEVAILRARTLLQPATLQLISSWSGLLPRVWLVLDEVLRIAPCSLAKVDSKKFLEITKLVEVI